MARRPRWLVLALLAAAASCGRSGFDSPAGTPAPTSGVSGSPFANPTAPPALAAWHHRRHVTVSGAGLAGVVTGFPAPLVLATSLDGAEPAGADVRFVDDTGTPLPWEIELWSSGATPSVIWVQSPSIAPGTGTSFWMYWGSAGAPDTQQPAAVFPGFSAVWHLDPSLRASTGAANDITVNSAPDATGLFGRGRSFDGTTNAILSVPDNASLDPTTAISISAWIHATDWNGNRRIVQKGDADNQYKFDRETAPLTLSLANVGTGSAGGTLPAAGAWHHVACTYDGATLRIYTDGALTKTQAASGNKTLSTTADMLHIGAKQAGGAAGDHFFGTLDEVRLSPTALSADWMLAEYESGAGTLLTLGAEESR